MPLSLTSERNIKMTDILTTTRRGYLRYLDKRLSVLYQQSEKPHFFLQRPKFFKEIRSLEKEKEQFSHYLKTKQKEETNT